MERLTHERANGIRNGYWSPNKKQELVDRLAEYENTGLTPEEILNGMILTGWIPTTEKLPTTEECILLSFENFSLPMVGRYQREEDGSGAFYLGDCDEEDTCIANDLFVNAWMPLPKPYREG